MERRDIPPVPTLSAEQQTLLDKFNELIAHPNEEQLVAIIDQLSSIPLAESPVFRLAKEGNTKALGYFESAVQVKAKTEAIKKFGEIVAKKVAEIQQGEDLSKLLGGVIREAKCNAEHKDSVAHGWSDGSETSVEDALSSSVHSIREVAVDLYDAYMLPIHCSEVLAYALNDGVEKNEESEKQFSLILKKFDRLYHSMWFDSFVLSEMRDTMLETAGQLVEVLIQYKKIEVAQRMVRKISSLESAMKALDLYCSSNELEKFLLISDENISDKNFLGYMLDRFTDKAKRKYARIIVKHLAPKGDVEIIETLFSALYVKSMTNTDASIDKDIDAVIAGYKAGGFELKSKKIARIKIIFDELLKKSPPVPAAEVGNIILNLINAETDQEVKKALLIDCLYKKTILGSQMWWRRAGMSTPTLKLGALNQVVAELVKLGVEVVGLPGCEGYSSSMFGMTYPSKKQLFGLWPHNRVQENASEVGLSKMLWQTKEEAVPGLLKQLEELKPVPKDRAALLFGLINKVGLQKLKITLLVECLYKDTPLGKECWTKYGDTSKDTPTLKRGVLNQIVEELRRSDVDLIQLPGFNVYSLGMFGPTYPSKTNLAGKMPPAVVPMIEREVKRTEYDSDTESEGETPDSPGSAERMLNNL